MARVKAHLRAKFHLDPSNRLATVHQCYRQTGQTGQTGQRSDGKGRTVLQTVAQQKLHVSYLASTESMEYEYEHSLQVQKHCKYLVT